MYDRERLWLCRKRREPRLELELLRVCIGSNKAHETGVSEALADEYWLGSTKLNTQVTHLEGSEGAWACTSYSAKTKIYAERMSSNSIMSPHYYFQRTPPTRHQLYTHP